MPKQSEQELMVDWLVGQVAGRIAEAVHHGALFTAAVADQRRLSDDHELEFDAPPAFTPGRVRRLSHTERDSYRRITGLHLDPADFDRAVARAEALVDELRPAAAPVDDTVTIESMRRFGATGWRWTIRLRFPDGDVVRDQRTNESGAGLWTFGEPGTVGYAPRQVRGEMQWQLPEGEKHARGQLISRAKREIRDYAAGRS